jgi:tetratricopeptide (TPR) repeat protein
MLDLVYERLRAEIAELGRDPRGFKVADRYVVTHSTFRANLHASSRQPARLGLAYEVLQGFPTQYSEELLEDLGYQSPAPGTAAPLLAEIFLRSKLGEYVETGPAIEEWILRSFLNFRDSEPNLPYSHVHVELIDDLDRCPESYTADVLAALNYWSTLENVFFVIAADEGHLQRSAQAATDLHERYAGEALEKFVHVQLRMPELIGSSGQAASFAALLLPKGDDLPAGIDHLRKLLSDAGEEGPFGLLAPALDARTPRQAKRVLNELLQEFRVLRDFEGDSVKRIVARLAWPREFHEYIFPALLGVSVHMGVPGGSPRSEWLGLFLRAASTALESNLHDPAAAAARLREVAAARGIDMQGCPVELLLYLAAPPALQPPEPTGISDSRRWQRFPSSGLGSQSEVASFSRPNNVQPNIADVATKLQVAYELGRYDEVRALGQQLVTLGQAGITQSEAPTVGNAALRLGRIDPDLSWITHQLAMNADPSHGNIGLNAADFLLDNGDASVGPIVEEILDRVALTTPDFTPARQRLLRARLAASRGVAIDSPELLVEDSAREDEPSSSQWERLEVLRDTKLYDLAEEVGRNWARQQAMAGEWGGVATALRAVGDALCRAPARSDAEGRGIDLLRYLLCIGFFVDDDTLSGAANNLAVILALRGFHRSAAVLYRVAYEIDPRDSATKAAYSLFLLNTLSDPQNAYAVQQGQEVTIPVPGESELGGAFAELPGHLSSSERWWEDYEPLEPLKHPPFAPMSSLCPRIS